MVCDRYADSTIAYQGYGRGLDLETLRRVNALATGGLRPALTFLLDVPVDEGLRRKGASDDRFEEEGLAFHRRVRTGYLRLAREEPRRILVVDGRRPAREIARRIWARVAPLLPVRGAVRRCAAASPRGKGDRGMRDTPERGIRRE